VAATSSLEILCVYGIIWATTEPLGNYYIMALGRTQVLPKAAILAEVVELMLLALVVKSG
jgi:hypothetical protein